MSTVKYVGYVIFHPFDGFYTLKSIKNDKYLVALVIFILYGLIQIVSYQYTGFIMNHNPVFRMNSINIFVLSLMPFVIFIVSNWSITTLFNGSGKIGDIFVVTSFSIFPRMVFDFLTIFLSNFVIQGEVPILIALISIGTLWSILLTFCGLAVVHEYTALENVKTIIASFIASAVIMFLVMIYSTLMIWIVNFILSIINEISRRWWLV